MDIFTNLCVCPNDQENNEHHGFAYRGATNYPIPIATDLEDIDTEIRRKIVYPVARYPARLNSPELVQQRRRSLQKHLMFRPVTD